MRNALPRNVAPSIRQHPALYRSVPPYVPRMLSDHALICRVCVCVCVCVRLATWMPRWPAAWHATWLPGRPGLPRWPRLPDWPGLPGCLSGYE
eukprot:300481-Chlamydomonas_euryale.AAC.1